MPKLFHRGRKGEFFFTEGRGWDQLIKKGKLKMLVPQARGMALWGKSSEASRISKKASFLKCHINFYRIFFHSSLPRGFKFCMVSRENHTLSTRKPALTVSLKNKPITILLCMWRLMKGNDGRSIRHSVCGWKLYFQRMFWTKYDSKSLVEWLNLNDLPPTICDVIKG